MHGDFCGSDRSSVNDLVDEMADHATPVRHSVRSCGCLRICAFQHVGKGGAGSGCCDSSYSQLGSGTGTENWVLAAAAGFAALVTQSGVQHGSHDGPCLGVSAPWSREVVASTDHWF